MNIALDCANGSNFHVKGGFKSRVDIENAIVPLVISFSSSDDIVHSWF